MKDERDKIKIWRKWGVLNPSTRKHKAKRGGPYERKNKWGKGWE